MARTPEQQVESFAKRLFTTDEAFAQFLLTVIRDKLYQQTPAKTSHEMWLRNLYITCLYCFGGVSQPNLGNRYDISSEGIRQAIRKTLNVLYARSVDSGYTTENHPFNIEILTGKPHNIAYFIRRHQDAPPSQLLTAITQKFNPDPRTIHVLNRLLSRYGVELPGTSVRKLKKAENDQILQTSTNPNELKSALSKVGKHAVIHKKYAFDNRAFMYVHEVAEAAGFSMNNMYVRELVAELRTRRVPVRVIKYVAADTKRNKSITLRYSIIAKASFDQAKAILEKFATQPELHRQGVEHVKGTLTREVPSFTEFRTYPLLSKLLRKLKVAVTRGTHAIDYVEEDAPVPIFSQNRDVRYHPEDETILTHYLQQKHPSSH